MFKLIQRVRIQKGPVFLGKPIVSQQGVYLGWDQIYRIDRHDFGVTWCRTHEGFSALLVAGDVLLVGTGLALIALDPASGEKIWARDSTAARRWKGQLVSFEKDCAVVLDPSTGHVVTRMDLPGWSGIYELKKDILLYTRADGGHRSVAYNLAEKRILWERALLEETKSQYGAPGESMSMAAGTRAIIITKPDVGIFGCSMDDGRILWYQKAFVSFDIPVAHGGYVYALTLGHVPTLQDSAKFLCFDELTGEKIYETEHGKLLTARPSRGTVFDGHIAFGSRYGWILVFRLSDGELVWSHRTRGGTWQPTMAGDRLYITSDDGWLLVFERKRSRSKS